MQTSTATVPTRISSKPQFPANEKRISLTTEAPAPPGSNSSHAPLVVVGDSDGKARQNKRSRRKRNKSNSSSKNTKIGQAETADGTPAEGSAEGFDASSEKNAVQNNNNNNNNKRNGAKGGRSKSPTRQNMANRSKNSNRNKNNQNNKDIPNADAATSSPTSLPADLEKIRSLEAKLEGAHETIDELVTGAKDLDVKLATLTTELLAAHSKIETIMMADKGEEEGEDNVATWKAKLERLEKEKAEEAWDLQKEKEGMEQELSAVKEMAQALEEETVALQSKVEDLEAKNDTLEKEKDEYAASLKAEKESLEAKLEELEKAKKGESTALLAEVENLKSKCDMLEKDKEATKTALSQMKSMELSPVDNTEGLEALRGENQKLAILLKDAQSELDRIQETFMKDQAALQRKVEEVETKNSILEKEKEEHAASLKAETESFEAQLEELEKAKKDESTTLLAEVENLKSKCDILEKDKEATETALSQMKSMELPTVDNTEELEALRGENQKLAIGLKSAQSELDSIKENFIKDRAQLEQNLQLAHDAQVQQAKEKQASLEQALQKTQQELNESTQNAQPQMTSRAAPAEEDKVTKIWQEKLEAKAMELKDTEKRLKAVEADKLELESQLEKVVAQQKPWWLCEEIKRDRLATGCS